MVRLWRPVHSLFAGVVQQTWRSFLQWAVHLPPVPRAAEEWQKVSDSASADDRSAGNVVFGPDVLALLAQMVTHAALCCGVYVNLTLRLLLSDCVPVVCCLFQDVVA